jgi:HSP20 family protein
MANLDLTRRADAPLQADPGRMRSDLALRRAAPGPHPWRHLREAWQRLRFEHAVRQLGRQIVIELSETPQAYMVRALLPGADKGDIEVALDGNRVRIIAAAGVEHERHESATVLRRERYLGRRSRTLTLDHEIDAARASAEYRQGVLRLALPKVGPSRGLVPVR